MKNLLPSLVVALAVVSANSAAGTRAATQFSFHPRRRSRHTASRLLRQQLLPDTQPRSPCARWPAFHRRVFRLPGLLTDPRRADDGPVPGRTRVTDFIAGGQFPFNRLQQPEWQKFLPLSATTLAEELAARGYVTALFGKWHLARATSRPKASPRDPTGRASPSTSSPTNRRRPTIPSAMPTASRPSPRAPSTFSSAIAIGRSSSNSRTTPSTRPSWPRVRSWTNTAPARQRTP